MPLPGKKSLFALRAWYARNERRVATLSLLTGFVVDSLTLTRVDRVWENAWIGGHIVVVSTCIVLLNRQESGEGDPFDGKENPERVHFWLMTALQFLFGGLLSAFLVFYFRSAALTVSWPFIVLIVAAFAANEAVGKKSRARVSFQASFLFLSAYLFSIYLVPVLIGKIGSGVFLLSGAAAIAIFAKFLFFLRRFARKAFERSKRAILYCMLGILVLINTLYFLDLIPPLPLSLQNAGIYHSVKRMPSGDYEALEEPASAWHRAGKLVGAYPPYRAEPGEPAYAYSAIYSPISFHTTVIHEWQAYDETTHAWKTRAQIPLGVSGGRASGYRTYSIYGNLSAGRWRVNVKTRGGQTIGRMAFTVLKESAREIRSIVKD